MEFEWTDKTKIAFHFFQRDFADLAWQHRGLGIAGNQTSFPIR